MEEQLFGQTWSLGGSFDFTTFHTFKITKTGTNMELFIDGVSQGTKTVTATLTQATIGAGYTTQNTNMNGVIDWFKLKNFV